MNTSLILPYSAPENSTPEFYLTTAATRAGHWWNAMKILKINTPLIQADLLRYQRNIPLYSWVSFLLSTCDLIMLIKCYRSRMCYLWICFILLLPYFCSNCLCPYSASHLHIISLVIRVTVFYQFVPICHYIENCPIMSAYCYQFQLLRVYL